MLLSHVIERRHEASNKPNINHHTPTRTMRPQRGSYYGWGNGGLYKS